MGRYCQVVGCRANCNKEDKSMFGFPVKNKKLLKLWLDSIPGEVHITQNTGICEDHFQKEFLVVKDTKSGKTRKLLLKDAVPTIFPTENQQKPLRIKKTADKQDAFEHGNNCRLCLKTFAKLKEKLQINDLVEKRFKNITSMKLRKSTVYSKFVCVTCYRNLKYFSTFKDELVKNQLKLYENLEALEDFDEFKDEKPMEVEVLETYDGQAVAEIIEEIPYEDSYEVLDDDEKYIEELNDDSIDDQNEEEMRDRKHEILYELEIESLASIKEEVFENDIKHPVEVLEDHSTYLANEEIKEEKSDDVQEYSIFDLPKWDDYENIEALESQKWLQDTNSSTYSTIKKRKSGSTKKKQPKKKPEEGGSEYRRPQVHIKYGSRLCPMCGKTFSGGRACRVHVERTHLKIKRYTCDLCGYRSYMKDHLKSHMTSHIKERTIKCDQCDRVFNRLQCLRVHVKSAHSDERTHICECGKTYKTHSALYTHMRYWHSDEKKFQCSVCDYVAYDNNKLKDHLRIHSDKPELKCPYCDDFFYTLVKLRLHKQTMHEEPRFTCEFCGQKFHLQSKLKIHMKSHLGQKDFQCPYCEMKYFKNSALNRHIMHYHMKLRMRCEIPGCSSQFARKETYKNHVLSHHKDIGDENVQILLARIRDYKQPTETSVFKLNNLRGHV